MSYHLNHLYKDQLQALESVGIQSSRSLFNAVCNNETKLVAGTIALFKAIKRHKNISDRETFFLALLNSEAAVSNAMSLLKGSDTEERKAMFDYWLSLSIKSGKWNSFKDIEGSRYVFVDGSLKEKFNDVWNRGWTVQYFMKNLDPKNIMKLETPLESSFSRLSSN